MQLFCPCLDQISPRPKVIGAPQVTESTGMALAQSSLDTALEWTAVEEIFGGVFDTTSSNTGIKEGAMSALKPNNKLQESSHRSVSLKIFKVGNLHSPKSST